MQKRAVRFTFLALLVVAGLGAAYVTWDTHSRIRGGLARERDVDARLDRMSAATASLGASQQAYVAPGQQRGDALTHASVLVQQLYDAIAALRLVARSDEAAASLLAFGQALDALVNVDDRAREHLREEQQLMAADLVYTEARQAIGTMRSQIDALRASEGQFTEAERSALIARLAPALGGVALLWLAGVLVLVRAVGVRGSAPAVVDSHTEVETSAPVSRPVHSVDLNAAAAVCTELSRLASAAALPPALRRAARVLDAPGVIVWLGAGEELFPASAHGYGPRALARLGPIPRAGDNAAAAAWRTAQTSIVAGGEGANGAIVAPLISHSGCFGVLTAEVRHGREHDEATRAVATMIAAQLSAVVAPWPAASEGGETRPDEPTAPSAPEQTAASA
jgi:hypothetical protein